MKNFSLYHWFSAFACALFCHAALAMAWFSTEAPPKIERSAGAPIEIIGSLALFAPEQKAVEETIQDVVEPVEEDINEKAVQDPPIEEIKPKKIQELKDAILPKAVPKKKPKKKKVKKRRKKKLQKKYVKKDKHKRKKRRSGKRIAALQKGGGAKGKQSRLAGAAISNYRGRVQSHLARYKRRLGGARKGTTVVGFSLARSGRVTSVNLVRSSGSSAIDRATLAMVRRASPFPPIPPGGPSRMRFTVPVAYR